MQRSASFVTMTNSTSLSVAMSVFLVLAPGRAADWPSWGGQSPFNRASETEKGLTEWYALGDSKSDPSATKNIKWSAKLGDITGGSPAVSQGRVFIGTKDGRKDILLCLDEQTGRELGRPICSKPDRKVEHRSVCSTPTIERDRLYLVSPYGEALCVNLASWGITNSLSVRRQSSSIPPETTESTARKKPLPNQSFAQRSGRPFSRITLERMNPAMDSAATTVCSVRPPVRSRVTSALHPLFAPHSPRPPHSSTRVSVLAVAGAVGRGSNFIPAVAGKWG